MRSKQMRGFTLIELMIVLVILGILAAIALPAYNNQVVTSRRSDCMGILLGLAQAMEKHYSEKFNYLAAAASGADTGAPLGTLYPAQCPLDGDVKFYDLTIQVATANTFTVRATPVAGTSQAGDGLLEVNHLGQKGWDRNGNSNTTDAGEKSWTKK